MAQNPNRAARRAAHSNSRKSDEDHTSNGITVTRAADFRAYYADELVANNRQYDTMLSFFMRTDEPHVFETIEDPRIDGSSGVQPLQLKSAIAEIVRVHVPKDNIFGMAMQLLDEYITDDLAREKQVESAIRGLINLRKSEAKANQVSQAE